MAQPTLSLAREFEAALAWWQAAGVDHDFTDDATAWLADAPLDAPPPAAGARRSGASQGGVQAGSAVRDAMPRAPAPAQPSPLPEVIRRNLLGDSPPADLPSFRQWWLESDALDAARTFPRIAPRGQTGSALMVLVPQPEEGDRERLLEGPQGRLLANILAAMGIRDEVVYIASALPSHMPVADLAMLAASGMDAVLAHHIALAAPQRLLVFGTGLAALLPRSGEQPLREINHAHGKVPVMVSETLDALMEMPRLKARFWKRWMEWSA